MKKRIDIRELIRSKNPVLLKWLPGFVISYLERVLHQEEINQFLEDHKDLYNEDFCDAIMNYLNIEVTLEGIEHIEGKENLVFASNHPLGGMDAIALVSGMRKYRTGLKFIVNDLLLHLNHLNGLFLGVNKHGKNSLSTREQIDQLFASEHIVTIFPAGLVSRKNKKQIRDLVWKKTFVTLSKRNNRWIVPVFVDGRLSPFFYNLANLRKKMGIKANIEMLYLSDELFKLRGSKIKITLGQPIAAQDLDESKTDLELAQYVKEKVYDLEK